MCVLLPFGMYAVHLHPCGNHPVECFFFGEPAGTYGALCRAGTGGGNGRRAGERGRTQQGGSATGNAGICRSGYAGGVCGSSEIKKEFIRAIKLFSFPCKKRK